jgi:hypothetical protein
MERLSPAARLAAALERRLSSAPKELQAATAAKSVHLDPLECEFTAAQEAAAQRQIQALKEARAAFHGRRDDEDDFADGETLPIPAGRHFGSDRVAAMGEAIVEFDRSARALRGCGFKLTVRDAENGERVDLAFRRAASAR